MKKILRMKEKKNLKNRSDGAYRDFGTGSCQFLVDIPYKSYFNQGEEGKGGH